MTLNPVNINIENFQDSSYYDSEDSIKAQN